MRAHVPMFLKRLNAKQAVALGIAPGILAVGLDAAVAHLAGREDVVIPAQWIPVLFAPTACLALATVALRKDGARRLRRGLTAVGALGVAVGTLGTFFHARAFARLLEGTPLTFQGLEAALAVAPPLFAPGAFAAIGALLWALAQPRVKVGIEPRTAPLALWPTTPRTPLRRAA